MNTINEHSSVDDGSALMRQIAPLIKDASITTKDPLLFYAGLLGGMVGHMAAVIGCEGAMAVIEFIKPLIEGLASKYEGKQH